MTLRFEGLIAHKTHCTNKLVCPQTSQGGFCRNTTTTNTAENRRDRRQSSRAGVSCQALQRPASDRLDGDHDRRSYWPSKVSQPGTALTYFFKTAKTLLIQEDSLAIRTRPYPACLAVTAMKARLGRIMVTPQADRLPSPLQFITVWPTTRLGFTRN